MAHALPASLPPLLTNAHQSRHAHAQANKSLGDEVNWTCEIDRVLPPKVGQTGAAANEPVTVFTRFRRILEECAPRASCIRGAFGAALTRRPHGSIHSYRHGAHPALHFKRNGEWQSLTFDEYFGQVKVGGGRRHRCAGPFPPVACSICYRVAALCACALELGLPARADHQHHWVQRTRCRTWIATQRAGLTQRAEWMIAYLGTIAIGGVPAGVYTTNSPQMCHYVASHSQAQVGAAASAQLREG